MGLDVTFLGHAGFLLSDGTTTVAVVSTIASPSQDTATPSPTTTRSAIRATPTSLSEGCLTCARNPA